MCSEMMEQSLVELRTTVDDLEKRMEGLDEESMLHCSLFFCANLFRVYLPINV
jgi:hypothetical protein